MNVSLHLSRCLRNAVRFLTLLCALALAACTQDDDAVGGAPVEVCLAVTADHEETLPARQAADDTEEGRTHEYMHELCVFIVDADGKIEHRVLPDLSGDDDAARGDLKEWTSYPILLTPGEKTLYAFANWQTAADKDWIALVYQTEGAQFDVEKLNSIVLDDPAAKLNFGAGRFIPMAASTTATVTASTRELSIGLDRLVSKLRLTARLDEEGVGIRGCTFEGVATQCHLLDTAPADSRTKSYTMPDPKLVDGVYVFPDVYINGNMEHHVCSNLNVSFAYVEGESLMMAIKDIAVSSGSACTSASLEPSYVLRALGRDDELAHSSIRFSLGRFTTEEEIDFTIKTLTEQVAKLREMSPLWEMHQQGVDLSSVKWSAH